MPWAKDLEMDSNPHNPVQGLGVVAVNSVSYARQLLENLESGLASVPLRGVDDHERISRTGVEDVVSPPKDFGWCDWQFCSQAGDEVAHVAFTSGTEGPAKAVYLSRSNLHDVVVRLSKVMEISSDIREYIGVPIYHSFGYGRVRVILNAGGRCYIPENGFNLLELRQMLKAGSVNAVSAVPSLWRTLIQSSDLFGPELEQVRWIEIGSQHMPSEEKVKLKRLFPNAIIAQHYGLTEASRSTFLRIDRCPKNQLESVGKPVGATEVRIASDGRIEVKGPHVALGIDDGDRYCALSKDQWFQTSDLGKLESDALLYEGRADDVINISGLKVSPDSIEDYVRQNQSIKGDFGIGKIADATRGEIVLIALTEESAEAEPELRARVADFLNRHNISGGGAITARIYKSLPRTSTGKLQRKLLVITGNELPSAHPAESEDTATTGLERDICQALDIESVTSTELTFSTSGGDSLAHIQLSMALERALGYQPENWEHKPLLDLINLAKTTSGTTEPIQTPDLPAGDRNMNPADISFWDLIREDYLTNDASLTHQGFLMLLIHRFGNWRMSVRWRLARIPLSLLYRILNKLTQLFFGMKLDYTVEVGRRVKLEHFGGMILGARKIGNDVILRQNTTLGIRSVDDLKAKPIIGNNVDIGAGAVIVGNIRIGDNCIIGANSVVYTSVPANSVVVGVPGKVIGRNRRDNPSPLG